MERVRSVPNAKRNFTPPRCTERVFSHEWSKCCNAARQNNIVHKRIRKKGGIYGNGEPSIVITVCRCFHSTNLIYANHVLLTTTLYCMDIEYNRIRRNKGIASSRFVRVIYSLQSTVLLIIVIESVIKPLVMQGDVSSSVERCVAESDVLKRS